MWLLYEESVAPQLEMMRTEVVNPLSRRLSRANPPSDVIDHLEQYVSS
jgi:hypothetical protein